MRQVGTNPALPVLKSISLEEKLELLRRLQDGDFVSTASALPVVEPAPPTDPVGWSRARSRIAADRPAEPHEIAAVIAFLLTEDASYMTGAVVVVDGGHTAGWRNTDWQAVTRAVEPRAPRRFGLDR